MIHAMIMKIFKAFQGMNVGIIRGGVDGERFKSFAVSIILFKYY